MSDLMDDAELRGKEPDLAGLENAEALVSTDFPQARVKFEELANQGSVMAMLYLAFALSQRGDMEDAKRWYHAAYEKGSSTALFSWASIEYHTGNLREAERLWDEGVSKNDGPCMVWLASRYLGTSDEAKHAEARRLLEKAHEQGQLRATLLLGKSLATGKYGIGNIPRGLFLFLKFTFSAFGVAY